MALSDIRNKVIEFSGRYDLDDAEATVGVDEFISNGQKLLDQKLDGGKSFARHFQNLDYQQVLIQVPGARAVTDVWLFNATERVQLSRVDLNELRTYYYEKTSSITVGEPIYWTPVCIRPYPSEVYPATYNQEWAFDEIIDSGSDSVNGILLMPPADSGSAYTLDVYGKYWTEMPTNAEGTSYWISQHPMLLVWAALYHMEVSYRNTEGMKDWMLAIDLAISELNKDIYEDEDINQMEG